jgi:structural maintenance of chromosome 4
MSGGRNHVAKGGMSSKLASDADSSQTLKAYEKESEEATKQLEEALQNLRGIEAEVENLGKSGPQIMKINLNIQGCSRRMAEDHLSPVCISSIARAQMLRYNAETICSS